MRLLLLLASLSQCSVALNFLVYNPMMGRSHVTFMGRISEVLTEAGHNVTMLGPIIEASLGSYGTTKANIITIPQSEEAKKFEGSRKFADAVWQTTSVTSLFEEFRRVGYTLQAQCNATLNHPGLLEALRKEHFDAAFTEGFDCCGWGIIHLLGIEKTASTLSIATFEGGFSMTGVPFFASYVPGSFASSGPEMTFFQRMGNILSMYAMRHIMGLFAGPTDELFAERYGEDFPTSMAISEQVSLTFLNSEPLIDFPRPTAHSIIEIGGITVSTNPKPLNQSWDAIFNLRPKTVLLSFGTVAKSFAMPDAYKKTIRETFRKFPEVTFLWKYEKPEDKISEGIPNLIEGTFFPQRDMLNDPRLSLFITHCGQGSTTEAVTAGTPLIVIPVMGDQVRNSQIVKRLGTGVVLNKEDLGGSEALESAIREVLDNPSYAENAKKVGQMIRDRPFDVKEIFVKNMEFLAKYGPLRQLSHYGKELNFIQYWLIDVFAFIGALLLSAITILFLLVRTIFRCAFRFVKVKKD